MPLLHLTLLHFTHKLWRDPLQLFGDTLEVLALDGKKRCATWLDVSCLTSFDMITIDYLLHNCRAI